MSLPRLYILFLLLGFIACKDAPDEEQITNQLRFNNQLLEKQANLLEQSVRQQLFERPESNDAELYLFGQRILKELDSSLANSRSIAEVNKHLRWYEKSFNDTLVESGALPLELSRQDFSTNKYDLLQAWKRNNFLIFRVEVLEKSMELHELRTKDAFEQIQPVVFSKDQTKYRSGGNAIFDIAYKSRKAESSEIEIERLTSNGLELPIKLIEVDQFTQRFIVHNLKKGRYEVYGKLILTNNRGEKTAFPFTNEFVVD